MCYVLLAATAPCAVTSRSCEVVSYSRATRGDENARAGRGEDARGGESPGGRVLSVRPVRIRPEVVDGLDRRETTIAVDGVEEVGYHTDVELRERDALAPPHDHQTMVTSLSLCGDRPCKRESLALFFWCVVYYRTPVNMPDLDLSFKSKLSR